MERIADLKEANALLEQLESGYGMLSLDDHRMGKKSRDRPAQTAISSLGAARASARVDESLVALR